MSHPITMTWFNQSNDTFSFEHANAKDGTQPESNSSLLKPGDSAAVSADQKGNFKAGPVGSYDWLNANDANGKVSCSYIHPASKGETTVTVTCSGDYQVSSDGKTWYQAHTFDDDSLAHHSAEITLYIKAKAD